MPFLGYMYVRYREGRNEKSFWMGMGRCSGNYKLFLYYYKYKVFNYYYMINKAL